MKVLIVITHYWDPKGGGRHQSLRPDPNPRIEALQEQILSLRRLGLNQSVLHMTDRAVYRVNDAFRHQIDIKVVTDGSHHVLDKLDPAFTSSFQHIITSPPKRTHLGFESQKVLAEGLASDYDLYCYLEDDLIIHDASFFTKINWFTRFMGNEYVLLPQRVEFSPLPHNVDRFYIDGPLPINDVRPLVTPGPVRLVQCLGDQVPFAPPDNPHSGCFVLTHSQLSHWTNQDWWQDSDVSFISPLESAATLGVAKSFQLFKPCMSHAGWLEIQHYGTVFHELIGVSTI